MDEYDRREIIQQKQELVTTFYVGLASFTVLVWDHILTLGDEVRYIWRKKKGPLIWLFFLNRYLTPLAFIVNLFAYFSPVWTPESCARFVRYEGSMTVIGINTSALMMLLRIYAMYDKNMRIVLFVAAIFVTEVGMNAWLLTKGIPVHRTPQLKETACTMIFETTEVPKVVAAASAWLPLLYDTVVLALTVTRSYSEVKHPTVGRTMRILLKEGVWYYSVIFCITLVLTLMIVLAPAGLQNVTAQTEYLMTVAMMSRITLHLKREAHRPPSELGSHNTTYDLTSSINPSGRHSPIRFAHGHIRSSIATTPMTVTVQEGSITHDDHGKEIWKSAVAHVKPKRTSWEGEEEWFEFSPMGHTRNQAV